jgi:hypothetical protein
MPEAEGMTKFVHGNAHNTSAASVTAVAKRRDQCE